MLRRLLLLLIWKHFFFYFINGYLFTRQLKQRLFVIRGLNLNQNWRYISVSMCDSNDVKFTGKVCGLDEPIQCVSTRPPLAQIRPNWLGSIDVLAVYYLEEFLNASRPRLRVFPRRNSSFLPSKKPTFATTVVPIRSGLLLEDISVVREESLTLKLSYQ